MTFVAVTPANDIASLKRHSLVGLLAVAGLFGGLVFWASITDISGAVIAGGSLVVESFSKQIQHQDGGTVREILVHNDDSVIEGQTLIVLDDTAIRASLGVVTAQYNEAAMRSARLTAGIAGETSFAFPADMDATDPSIASLKSTQDKILASALADRDGRVAQLSEQITQLEHQIEGLAMQQTAAQKQLDIITARSKDMDALYANHLIEGSQVSTLHLQQAAAEGEVGRLVSAVAQTRATISEKRLAIEQIKTDFMSASLDELQKARQTIAEAQQQMLAGRDRLGRTIIKSPQTGIVHESIVHTIGGVVAPGQTLMQIVPQSDALLVAIRIDPNDVDQISVGQKANLRFSSFDRRKTPEVFGFVARVSPDFVQEPQTGRRYYTADVRIPPDQMDLMPKDIKLLPGMPVEAFVTTGDRSVLSYLIHPITEELQLAFREP